MIGGFRSKKESGSKIIINVNKKFCSNKDQQNRCALRTGSWDGSATVQVDIGGSAQILGAGGDGGKGADGINNNGNPGGDGSSGLGIEHNNVTVNIASGAILRAGFGGGGGGGAFTTSVTGVQTSSVIVGIGTTTTDDADLQGIGNTAKGLYISNGMMIMDNTVHGNHYIGTNFNGLMVGPVNINGTISIDGNYVVV